MTTWVLIVTILNGNATIQTAIPNLVSYAECTRVSKHIPSIYGRDPTFKCIEVYSR